MQHLRQLNPAPDTTGHPSLRTGLIVYLLITVGSVALTVGLNTGALEITFLRLATALFVVLGFTVAALLLTGIRLGAINAILPKPIFLILGFLGGVAVWIPASFVLVIVSQTLGGLFGNLPRPVVTSGLSATAIIVILGLIIPICQGFFFHGYLLTASRGIGVWRGAWLVALLYGAYGLLGTGRGMSAIPGYFLVGLIAATLTIRSRSALVGILVLSGFSMGEPIFADFVTNTLVPTNDILSIPWLASTIVSGFLTFLLIQAGRLFETLGEEDNPPLLSAPTKRFWWWPLIPIGLLVLYLSYGEIVARSSARAELFKPTPRTTSPILPTATPVPTQKR